MRVRVGNEDRAATGRRKEDSAAGAPVEGYGELCRDARELLRMCWLDWMGVKGSLGRLEACVSEERRQRG